MRLLDRFQLVSEQLRELYHHKILLDEKIHKLELELEDMGELIDFAECLNTTENPEV
ncbi:MAG: hypothetical protein SFT81_03860 [Candidatus Caenarcaniphilales bacterium]|nr:hypothetical protein [Candidatus Caenarcaniphilales bacterium]